MPRICYVERNFSTATHVIIDRADDICTDYANRGYTLTLRQVYYQFVARGWLANKDSEYKRLGGILNDARLAGLLDWDHMEDRTRNLRTLAHWDDPPNAMQAISSQYRIDLWADQPVRPECWIEKDALVGVIQPVCNRLRVPYFSCRGYTSQSELWNAAQRLGGYLGGGQRVLIVHLGDHDPSGIDMTRDIGTRLQLFLDGDGYDAADLEVNRIALNMNQVRQYDPPPNPAKLSDSRADGYIRQHGESSWELDALTPEVIDALIQETVTAVRDEDRWDIANRRERRERQELTTAARRWDEVTAVLRTPPNEG